MKFRRKVPASRLAVLAALAAAVLYASLRPQGSPTDSAAPEQAPRLQLTFRPEDYRKLLDIREKSLAALYRYGNLYVPAEIAGDGRLLKASVRLKGDSAEAHFPDPAKWSLRVRLKGDESLFGMKVFSLQHPRTLDYLDEWVFQRAYAREGGIAKRYRFVRLRVNEEDWGVMALIEHFDKRLLENNRRREGPILRFDGNLQLRRRVAGADSAYVSAFHGTAAAPVGFYGEDSDLDDPVFSKRLRTAAGLLEGLRRGRYKAGEVLDVERFAAYAALASVFEGLHALVDINMGFYYNPVTSRLEPIAEDSRGHTIAFAPSLINYKGRETRTLLHRLFEDDEFTERYIGKLEAYSRKDYLESLFAELEPEIRRNLAVLNSEFLGKMHFNRRRFFKIQEGLRADLAPLKAVNACFREREGRRITLDLANLQWVPVEILGLYLDATPLPPERPVARLRPREDWRFPEYSRAVFNLPPEVPWEDGARKRLTLRYKLLGGEKIWEDPVADFPYAARKVPGDLLRSQTDLASFPFLSVDSAAKTASIKSGAWTLDRDLVVPAGWRLLARPGARLDFKSAAMLLSYSPVSFRGTPKQPVRFYSSDGTGQGLAVIDAADLSVLRHFALEGMAHPYRNDWELSGAANFYQSALAMDSVRFSGIRAEDALSVIRSSISISKALFEDTRADAFDGDFVSGDIQDSEFVRIGNDALDFSGSDVVLRGVSINRAGDKGMSVGERSRVAAFRISVSDAETGVAVKDRSEAEIEGLRLSACGTGLAVFKKKSEYGPAKLGVRSLQAEGVQRAYFVEEGSELRIDGSMIRDYGVFSPAKLR